MRMRWTFYKFDEEPCKSTAKASELCSPVFKGVQTDTRCQSVSPAIDFKELTSYISYVLVVNLEK